MRTLRIVVAASLLALVVAAGHAGIFDRGANKVMVPLHADTAPMPSCLPGDPPCQ